MKKSRESVIRKRRKRPHQMYEEFVVHLDKKENSNILWLICLRSAEFSILRYNEDLHPLFPKGNMK